MLPTLFDTGNVVDETRASWYDSYKTSRFGLNFSGTCLWNTVKHEIITETILIITYLFVSKIYKLHSRYSTWGLARNSYKSTSDKYENMKKLETFQRKAVPPRWNVLHFSLFWAAIPLAFTLLALVFLVYTSNEFAFVSYHPFKSTQPALSFLLFLLLVPIQSWLILLPSL